MKKGKEILCLALGILLGIAGTVFGGILYLRTHLIREYSLGSMEFSRFAAEIPSAARSVEGWSATAAGCALPRPADGSPLQSFRFCNPNYAGELIRKESERKIAAKHMKRWQCPVLAGGWNSSARHAVVGNGRNEVAEVKGEERKCVGSNRGA